MSKQLPFEMAPDAGIQLLLYVGEDEMKMSELRATSPSQVHDEFTEPSIQCGLSRRCRRITAVTYLKKRRQLKFGVCSQVLHKV